MEREYFLKTERMGFSTWKDTDYDLAALLWGSRDVTRFICASGIFTRQDIENRLNLEIENNRRFHIQYWPVFELAAGCLVGCCGIRPYRDEPCTYELGFHLRKEYWGRGYGFEAAGAVISYSFDVMKAKRLFAGHHPQNEASGRLLMRLGFQRTGDEFYEPTGLYHPSYELTARRPCVSGPLP